jgi:hypothetical protein
MYGCCSFFGFSFFYLFPFVYILHSSYRIWSIKSCHNNMRCTTSLQGACRSFGTVKHYEETWTFLTSLKKIIHYIKGDQFSAPCIKLSTVDVQFKSGSSILCLHVPIFPVNVGPRWGLNFPSYFLASKVGLFFKSRWFAPFYLTLVFSHLWYFLDQLCHLRRSKYDCLLAMIIVCVSLKILILLHRFCCP